MVNVKVEFYFLHMFLLQIIKMTPIALIFARCLICFQFVFSIDPSPLES